MGETPPFRPSGIPEPTPRPALPRPARKVKRTLVWGALAAVAVFALSGLATLVVSPVVVELQPIATSGSIFPGSDLLPLNTLGGCPNGNYYDHSTQFSLQEVVNCAMHAGFTGPRVITFVSMAYQESGFCPGAIESGGGACSHETPGCGSGQPNAEGILQEGTAGQCPSSGGAFSVKNYNPDTCSSYTKGSSNWGPIYFNPVCAFQWAYYYFHQTSGGDFNFWGSYLSGAYCQWAPNGYKGFGPVTCSGVGQNQANLPWGTVCPKDVCKET